MAAPPRAPTPTTRTTGLGPERTARGAGRFFEAEREERLGGFRVLRVRGVEEPLPLVDRLAPDDVDEDVLLLRDPGGEDVRVAMLDTLVLCHMRPTDHRSACRPGFSTGVSEHVGNSRSTFPPREGFAVVTSR